MTRRAITAFLTTLFAAAALAQAPGDVTVVETPKGKTLSSVFVEDRAILGRPNVGSLVVITTTQAVGLSLEKVPTT